VAPDDLAEGGLVARAREARQLLVGRVFEFIGQCRCPSL
jgi:hypothetical protein